MRVISKRKILNYCRQNRQAESPLLEWNYSMKICNAKNLHLLRKNFNNVDIVNKYTIFNIGGNNYRLITSIHYNNQYCYIREIWTHAEYSKIYNQAKLQRGEL